MEWLWMLTRLRGEAAEPAGNPPRTDPRATSVSLEAITADGSSVGLDSASYENHVAFTGETTFTESGVVVFGDGDGELQIVTESDGTLGPSAEPGVLHGAVVYRITAGGGRFNGASGLITSNFLLRPESGSFEETQVAVVFVP